MRHLSLLSPSLSRDTLARSLSHSTLTILLWLPVSRRWYQRNHTQPWNHTKAIFSASLGAVSPSCKLAVEVRGYPNTWISPSLPYSTLNRSYILCFARPGNSLFFAASDKGILSHTLFTSLSAHELCLFRIFFQVDSDENHIQGCCR
jgi:hypothetical protein